MEENALAMLLRQWLDERGVAVEAVISGFTPEHFNGASPPGRTATYKRLAGVGITWEFVEAIADMITTRATEHQQLLEAARPLWESVLASTERQDVERTTDIVATQREMLDLSKQLRQVQQNLANLRAQDQNLAWALVMTCQQMRSRIAALRATRGAAAREISASSWSYGSDSRGHADVQAAHLLEGWARRIAHFAQALVRPDEMEVTRLGNSGASLSDEIEAILHALDQDLAQATRQLGDTAVVSADYGDERAEPDPEYTGGGFLRSMRLNPQRLTPERFLPDAMTNAVMESDGGRVLNVPMIGLMRQGITIAPGITVLAGRNGTGKSVVLEALSYALQGEDAQRTFDHRPLSRRLAGALEIDFRHCPRPQDVWYSSYLSLQGKRHHHLSAGESFRIMLESMGSRAGVLYLLDEPEAGLAPPLTEDLVSWMDLRVEDGCQFIIATHSMTLASLEQAQVIMPVQ
ncbi:AAA family ATPase [Streptomyces sp. NPDC004286]|uniref:AAA family ATPase n=1 Tax=Streptomyces sp. NPDC004286 TaxID=3364696 RepID=UPI0036BEDB39